MQIHIARDGKATGPFSLEEVNRQLAAGTLSLTDQAWYEGASGWMPLSAVPGVTAAAAPPPRSGPPGMPVATAAPAAAAPATAGKNEPLAIWALVMGILGIICCGPLAAIPAIVCGHTALSKMAREPGLEGRGMAITGLVLGYFGVIICVFWLIFGGLRTLQQVMEQSLNK